MAPGNIQGGVYEAAVRKRWPSMLMSGDPSGGVATTPTQAAQFVAASSQRLEIADASQTGLDGGTADLSYAGWAYLTTLPGSGVLYGLASKDNIGAVGSRLYIQNAAGVVTQRGQIQDSGGATTVNSGSDPFAVETWYHLAVTLDRDGNLTHYINGSVSGTPASIATRSGDIDNAAPFMLGGLNAASRYLNGWMSCWGMWAKVLSAANVTALYNGGAKLTRAGLAAAELTSLVSYWDLNGDANDDHAANHLTNTNGVTFGTIP